MVAMTNRRLNTAATDGQQDVRVGRYFLADPALRVGNLKKRVPLRRPKDFARWSDGPRKAGLPE